METKKIFISNSDLDTFEKQKRTTFINSLSGYKGAFLIGTKNAQNQENLAIFSSICHVGANPPLLGFIHRPASVERHTYENILESKQFTLNSVSQDFIEKAHQTSARYTREHSEFEEVGLTPMYRTDFFAPFVQESPLQIGLDLQEIIPITSNDTILIIGKMNCIYLPEHTMREDGFVDHESMQSICVSGLDAYHSVEKISRFSYAKPNQTLKKI
jgi:flavin reductase (DIM6/NTAB) family NADH-FMN oxidoreductase RutF